jgi:two-component system OmpR family sensor kinase
MRARGIEQTGEELSLVELIREVTRDLDTAAALRGVSLKLDIRSHPHVRGCRRWLGRALANVVDNAIQHGPRGRPVRVIIDDHARCGRVEVHDAGVGLPRALRERVFEPFVALAHGTDGLGLTVARAALQAHGGTIRFLDSKHTVVRIEMPCHRSCRVH